MTKTEFKKYAIKATPLFGLIALLTIFLILGIINGINLEYAIGVIINQSIVLAIVATGAIFIYTLGSFDISLGSAVCVSALVGGITYGYTESVFLMLLACVVVAIFIALTNSALASIFNLPVFVTTIAMLSILNAVALLLIKFNNTGAQVVVPFEAVEGLDNLIFKLTVLISFTAVAAFIFKYTKIGKMQKFIGGNLVCSKLSGVSHKKMAIIAFVMSGIGVGLGAFLTIVYAPTITRTTGASIGMEVIIAIVFGGMPISGGARSKISAALIGAFSMTLLNQVMSLLNVGFGAGQIVRAIIFLVVVFLATSNQKQEVLTR